MAMAKGGDKKAKKSIGSAVSGKLTGGNPTKPRPDGDKNHGGYGDGKGGGSITKPVKGPGMGGNKATGGNASGAPGGMKPPTKGKAKKGK